MGRSGEEESIILGVRRRGNVTEGKKALKEGKRVGWHGKGEVRGGKGLEGKERKG